MGKGVIITPILPHLRALNCSVQTPLIKSLIFRHFQDKARFESKPKGVVQPLISGLLLT